MRFKDEDVHKTNFWTHYTHYDFVVMLFGFTNTLTAFMDLMNRVCILMWDQLVTIFIVYILVYSKPKEQHEEHLQEVLENLRRVRLYVKFFKCEFWVREV